jgi:hypothetical protein
MQHARCTNLGEYGQGKVYPERSSGADGGGRSGRGARVRGVDRPQGHGKGKGQHGRPYSIFGRLAAKSEEGAEVTGLGQTSHGSPYRRKSYPWDSVMDVEPLDGE